MTTFPKFRFKARLVRAAGLPSVPYAKALRVLWDEVEPVEKMERTFSRKVMQYLERNGYIVRHNGLYVLTALGVKTLYACGFPPTVKIPKTEGRP